MTTGNSSNEFAIPSPAQQVMREDMEAASAAVGPVTGLPLKRRSARFNQEPVSAGEVLDGVIGKMAEGWETAIFIQLVPDHPSMTLPLQQWNIIQAMVEDGIRRGYRRGTADAG